MTGPPDPVVVGPEAYDHMSVAERVRDRVAALTLRGVDQAWSERAGRRGVLGELAVVAYLEGALPGGCSVDLVAGTSAPGDDVLVRGAGGTARLQVATTALEYWSRNGQTVPVEQISTTDADAFVWCTTQWGIHRSDVLLMGWSPIYEVRRDHPTVELTGPSGAGNQPVQGLPEVTELVRVGAAVYPMAALVIALGALQLQRS